MLPCGLAQQRERRNLTLSSKFNRLRVLADRFSKRAIWRKGMSLPENTLVFHGYVKREDKQWVAVCVDLNIAAQGDTKEEAVSVCAEMIDDYLSYVCETHADELDKFIPRFAPPELIAEFTSAMMETLHAASRQRDKSAPSVGFEAAPIQVHNFDVDPSRLCAV